jgi:hypothetical protein
MAKYIIILLYVDDLLIMKDDGNKIKCPRKELEKVFEINYLGDGSLYFNIEIYHMTSGIYLCQQRYI